jgi:small-conductance mechanosensitive channel
MDSVTIEPVLGMLEDGAVGLGAAVSAVAVALVAHWIAFAVLSRVADHTSTAIDDHVIRRMRRPSIPILIVFALFLVLPSIPLDADVRTSVQRVLTLGITASIGWLAMSLTGLLNDYVSAHYDLTAADNLEARQVHTRVRLLQRVLASTILVITICLILMSIPSIRQIGVTLFASAGIAGIVAGLAARPTLSNLIAGVQLALTQPIRIDDVVIVEGEWGWIEEIGVTYVVVRVWDLRRLVVPLSYFIEQPFQNWTRTSADILGTVFFYVDYTVPVEEVRQELHRALEDSPLWDGKVWGLQVTDTTDRTLELRALMGARSSGDAWNLRCQVRERLVEYLQRQHPDALPRLRAEMGEAKAARAAKRRAPAKAKAPAEGTDDPSVAGPDEQPA